MKNKVNENVSDYVETPLQGNNYLNKSSFSKLLLFNWIQTRNSGLFWILLLLNSISLPLTSCMLYFLTNNFFHYTIFIILVPLISSFIQIMFLVYWLYLENKNNSINYKLFCSKYSRFHIALARTIFIVITLAPIIIINDLFCIFFIFTINIQFFGAMIIANTFINVFIYIIIICLLVLFSDRMGRIAYIFLGLFLVILTLGGSLISRPFLINETNNYITYREPTSDYNTSIQSTKLVTNNKDNILLIKNLTSSKLSQEDIIYDANKKIVFYNNFIPSEWTLTLYSSLFSLFDINVDYSHSSYNLLAANVNNNVNGNLNNLIDFYAIRPIDIDFTNLNNEQYLNIVLNDIDKIINKYELLSNSNLVSSFNESFILKNDNNQYSISNWNKLNNNAINFLKDVTGINIEFNQLFYLIKYPQLLINKLNSLFDIITSKYNESISVLFKNAFSSPNTLINLFQVDKFDAINRVLKTSNDVDDYYPMIETNSDDILNPIQININDQNFLRHQFLIFDNDNDPLFLGNDLNYISPSKTQLDSFKNLIGLDNTSSSDDSSNSIEKTQSAFDQDVWNNKVDFISLSYNTANNFLTNCKIIFPNLFDYALMGNSIDLSSFNGILNPVNGNQNGYGEIFIIFYIGLFILLVWLTIRKYQKYYKQQ